MPALLAIRYNRDGGLGRRRRRRGGGGGTENNHAVAFFRAPGVVQTLECAGDRIAVGCLTGEVLHLQAAWLVDS